VDRQIVARQEFCFLGRMGISDVLKNRTFEFAVAVFHGSRQIGPDRAAALVRSQLIRSSAGTAANYRAACRARSRREFIARIGVAIEEADESLFWLEFVTATKVVQPSAEWQKLHTEANELVAILTTSQKTARANEEAERQRKRACPRS